MQKGEKKVGECQIMKTLNTLGKFRFHLLDHRKLFRISSREELLSKISFRETMLAEARKKN